MNTRKLFNGLIIITLLLPAFLAGSPEPARAVSEPLNALNDAETRDPGALLSGFSALKDSAVQGWRQQPGKDAMNPDKSVMRDTPFTIRNLQLAICNL